MNEREEPVVAYVEWIDAGGPGSSGWIGKAAAIASAIRVMSQPVRSAGLLIDHGPDFVVLAVADNPLAGDVLRTLTIPRCLVRRMDVWAPTGNKVNE